MKILSFFVFSILSIWYPLFGTPFIYIRSGSHYKNDSISNIISRRSMFSEHNVYEKYLLGDFSMKQNSLQMNQNVKIKNQTWVSETLQRDGEWKIIVLEMTKDTKGKHTVFRLAAEPWPASFQRKSTHTGDDIIRRFSDCHTVVLSIFD